MNQEATCFNLVMTNIFIGLFNKNPLLEPHTTRIIEFGYFLHSVEPSFNSQLGTVNPEGIACSDISQHSIIAEWTAATRLEPEKEKQIQKYRALTPFELEEGAKVSKNAAKNINLWLVIPGSNIVAFKATETISGRNELLLSSLLQVESGAWKLSPEFGNVSDIGLSSILKEEMIFERVPEGYLPISLDELSGKKFKDGVVQVVVSTAIGTMGMEAKVQISIEDIARSMFSIFDFISTDKRKSITRAVKKVMREIAVDSNAHESWLSYEHPYWIITSPSDSKILKFARMATSENFTSPYEESLLGEESNSDD